MFVEAYLEGQKPLVRRLWHKAFEALDDDGDGLLGDADFEHCLRRLDVEANAEQRRAMLAGSGKDGGWTSAALLRLVLKPEAAPTSPSRERKRRSH